MTKKELMRFLEPFNDECEIKISLYRHSRYQGGGKSVTHTIIVPFLCKYVPSSEEDSAFVSIVGSVYKDDL